MLLDDAAHREGSDFHETKTPEIDRLDQVHGPLIDQINVGLVLQRGPRDRPKALAQSVLFERVALVRIVQMVIVDRR